MTATIHVTIADRRSEQIAVAVQLHLDDGRRLIFPTTGNACWADSFGNTRAASVRDQDEHRGRLPVVPGVYRRV